MCGLLLSVYLCGTFRTVFGASGTGQKEGSADLAAACSFRAEDLVLQFRFQRQNTAPKVLMQTKDAKQKWQWTKKNNLHS